MIRAINSKHQSLVTRVYYWLVQYNRANDLRDKSDDQEEPKEWRKHNKRCEVCWDKFEDKLSELPKREQNQIMKSDLY